MKILDVISKETILTDLKSSNKEGVLKELVDPVATVSGLNKEELLTVLVEREKLGSTGIGGGIGIPHGKLKNLGQLILGFGLSRKGIDFESMDGRPTHIFFLLFTPENSTDLHLKLLAKISEILKNEPFKNRLLKAGDRSDVLEIIRGVDKEF